LAAECGEIDALHPLPDGPWILSRALLESTAARSANPRLAGPHAWLAAAYALAGNSEGETGELVEARRLSGDNRYATFANFKRANALGAKLQALAEETFFAGLRLAGMSEE
jgi:hypothetical protein